MTRIIKESSFNKLNIFILKKHSLRKISYYLNLLLINFYKYLMGCRIIFFKTVGDFIFVLKKEHVMSETLSLLLLLPTNWLWTNSAVQLLAAARNRLAKNVCCTKYWSSHQKYANDKKAKKFPVGAVMIVGQSEYQHKGYISPNGSMLISNAVCQK